MIPARQPANEPLEQRHFADLHVRCEPLELADRIAITPHAQFAYRDDLQIDATDRVLIPPASEGLAGRLALIAGALIAASVWVVISLLPLPFASVHVNGPGATKGDRLQIPNAIVREPVSAGSQETSARLAAPTPPKRQPSTEAQRETTRHAAETPRQITSVRARSRDLETTKLVPMPDTRPTTIEGWALRDVTNGMATLEGPNGIWRVARGDTVPGLGRVDSIFQWGNRLMVATSSGLISTRNP
jgi:hypothetical protein